MLTPLDIRIGLWPFFFFNLSELIFIFCLNQNKLLGFIKPASPEIFHMELSHSPPSQPRVHTAEGSRSPFHSCPNKPVWPGSIYRGWKGTYPLLHLLHLYFIHESWLAPRGLQDANGEPQLAWGVHSSSLQCLAETSSSSVTLEVPILPFSFGNFTVLIVVLNSCSVRSGISVSETAWTT